MPLSNGQHLGPYEIQSTLGAGGMGEVYRARDTRLDRSVAIKVMPAALADDPQFRERFDREARVISSLSHPHICALFDVGRHEDIDFLVMEYLDGESLEQRLERSPDGRLSTRDALTIAVEIAGALDAAHRAGVVHRDLKPGNVMVTKSGAKLLDFGLAKTRPAVMGGLPSAAGATKAATMTSPPPTVTQQGTILGTFQYMAPEQIEGLEADARTDIFAFGALLFEMLTGLKAFEGKTRASLIGAILKDEPPPVSQVQPLAPTSLDRIVTTCLAKEPDDRWQTARDLLRELKWAAEGSPSASLRDSGVVRGFSPPKSAVLAWSAAAAALVIAGVLLVLWSPWRARPALSTHRLSAEVGAAVSLTAPGAPGTNIALSPDGELLAFVGQSTQKQGSQLYVRRLDQLQATPLAGSDDARDPFFSPNGQWIGFFAGGKLKKISVTGGAAVTLGDASNNDRGGWWGDDDTIVMAPNANSVLQRVSSVGGKAEPLMKLADGEVTQRWPQVLPGAKAVLFTSAASQGNMDNADIVVQALPDGTRKTVQRGGYFGRYAVSGHLLYLHGGTLFAAPFDVSRLELTGPPAPVLESVNSNTGTAGAQFTVSGNGTLAYRSGQAAGGETPILWMDREGKTSPLRAMPVDWSNPQFSPDGTRLAIDINNGRQVGVSIYEWTRDTLTQLTFNFPSFKPVWTPDGRRVAFNSQRSGPGNLYWQRADGSGDEQRLTESKNAQMPGSWHPNGRVFAFTEQTPGNASDLMFLALEGDEAAGWKPGKITTFLSTPASEVEPMFSPDGRWVAYYSNEGGANEIYVRPFPGPGGKWKISNTGGLYPMWSRTRHELFYLGGFGQIWVASYTATADSFLADKPRIWSPGRWLGRPRLRAVDLHPDGNRVALASASESQAGDKQDKVVFVFNFFDELRRVAPARK